MLYGHHPGDTVLFGFPRPQPLLSGLLLMFTWRRGRGQQC